MWVYASISRCANSEDQHRQGENGKSELKVLPVELAGGQGDLGEFVLHGALSSLTAD